jgi:hypothetical protein
VLNSAADCRPIIIKTTIERACIQRIGPHTVVWRVVSANDFHPELTAQADDFLKGYQPQVKNSDLDGKLRHQRLKFCHRLHDKHRIRN